MFTHVVFSINNQKTTAIISRFRFMKYMRNSKIRLQFFWKPIADICYLEYKNSTVDVKSKETYRRCKEQSPYIDDFPMKITFQALNTHSNMIVQYITRSP